MSSREFDAIVCSPEEQSIQINGCGGDRERSADQISNFM